MDDTAKICRNPIWSRSDWSDRSCREPDGENPTGKRYETYKNNAKVQLLVQQKHDDDAAEIWARDMGEAALKAGKGEMQAIQVYNEAKAQAMAAMRGSAEEKFDLYANVYKAGFGERNEALPVFDTNSYLQDESRQLVGSFPRGHS